MSPALRYDEFSSRLQQITSAVEYALHSIQANRGPIEIKGTDGEIERLTTDVNLSFRQATGNPMPRSFLPQAVQPLNNTLLIGESAAQLLMNLGLVMLCTQFELFINHLLDVVLATEPRRLKDLASKKLRNSRGSARPF